MRDTSLPIARRIADRVHAFGRGDLTPLSLAQARRAITDTVGVALAGAVDEGVRILRETPGVADGPGPALIWGTDRRTGLLDAALVNAAAAHALDYDDVCAVLGGHPSAPLVPALFAIAEARGLPGIEVVLAHVIGVETTLRIARAVNFHHYDKGWHPTATLGVFGAAAAASRLLGLSVEETATALGLAASLSAGIKANFGTMTKPLHVGQCSRNGVFAALLAGRGFTANAAAFEHPQGFLAVFNGAGTFDAERIFAAWGAPWEIEDPTMAIKQFPCCASAQPAILMALDLRAKDGVRAADVAEIQVMPHVRRLRHTDYPDPQSPLQAKFSVQYGVARALNDGVIGLADFEGEAFREPEIQRLLAATETFAHPDMPEDGAAQWGAEVVVTLADGRRFARRVDNVVGRGGDHPMSDREMWAKFADCARRSLPEARIAPLFDALGGLDTIPDVARATALMAVSRTSETSWNR